MAPVAGVAGAAAPASATASADETANSSYDNVLNTSNDSIGVWERAPFPLRANASEAATTIQNQHFKFGHWDPNMGYPSARYQKLGVFNADQSVPIDFEDTDLHNIQQFEGDNATVIVGKLNASSNDTDAVPPSIASFADLFGDENLSALNDNVSFTALDDPQKITAEGFSTSFTPSEQFTDGAGEYVVMAAVANETTDAPTLLSGDDLAPKDEVVFVGMDSVLAQNTTSTVSVGDAEPGDTVSFDANATVGSDDEVHHAVALMHKNTWKESETTFNITDEPGANFSVENISIESTIIGINGVSSIDEGSAMTERLATLGAILNGSASTDATTENTTLDASVVAEVNRSVESIIEVPTRGNWTEGTYQWVHIAGTDNGSLATNAGTITIEDSGGGGIPLPPPSPPGEPDISLVDTSLSSAKVGPGEPFEVSANYENAGDASGMKIVELTRDGQTVDSATINLAAGAEETVTFSQSIDEAGTYEYAIDGTVVGHVSVAPKEPAFETSNADVSDTDVAVGDSVDVTATVENTGDATGAHTAELVIDGETVDTTEVTLEPGESETVEFTHTFDESGEYEVGIDDAAAGTVNVEGGDGIPGFGPVAALLALAATLLIARTRAN